MNFSFKKSTEKDGSLKFVTIIPSETIESYREKALAKIALEATVKGFRKGKAPLAMVKSATDPREIEYEAQTLLVDDAYKTLLKDEELKPYVRPAITLDNATEKDWSLTFMIALEPSIADIDYNKIVKKVKLTTQEGDTEASAKQRLLNERLEDCLKEVKLTISKVIVDYEYEKRLADVNEQVKKLGMTLEQYLSSQNTDKEKMEEMLRGEITDVYKIQLLINQIAIKEKIELSDDEKKQIMLNVSKDANQNEVIAQASYFYNIMMRNKVLEFLTNI